MLVDGRELLDHAVRRSVAVGSFNVYALDAITAVVDAAAPTETSS